MLHIRLFSSSSSLLPDGSHFSQLLAPAVWNLPHDASSVSSSTSVAYSVADAFGEMSSSIISVASDFDVGLAPLISAGSVMSRQFLSHVVSSVSCSDLVVLSARIVVMFRRSSCSIVVFARRSFMAS